MGFFEKFAAQCRKPSGRFGRFLGRAMNFGHSKARHWGLNHISIKPDSCILDIGCGGGGSVKEMALSTPKGKVYGIDYSQDMVRLSEKVNKKLIEKGIVEIKWGSVSSLPFPDNTFDFVTTFETSYFWPDLNNDLKQIWRVLKPGGSFLLANQVYKDAGFEKRNRKLVNLFDMRIHTPDEYRDFLLEACYRTVEIDTLPQKNWIAAIAKK